MSCPHAMRSRWRKGCASGRYASITRGCHRRACHSPRIREIGWVQPVVRYAGMQTRDYVVAHLHSSEPWPVEEVDMGRRSEHEQVARLDGDVVEDCGLDRAHSRGDLDRCHMRSILRLGVVWVDDGNNTELATRSRCWVRHRRCGRCERRRWRIRTTCLAS